MFSILKRTYVLTESLIVGKCFHVGNIVASEKVRKSKRDMLHSLSAVK